jgi:hypothetical protein
VEFESNPIQTEAPPPPQQRSRQESNHPDPRSAATKDRELLSAVKNVAEVGWSSGKLILCSTATATQAPPPETLSLALFTGQTRGPKVLPTSRRPRDGRRRGEPQDSPAEDGAREVAFLFASLDCSKGKGKRSPSRPDRFPFSWLLSQPVNVSYA